MLHIQKFLREGGSLEELAAKPYAIDAKRHDKYPNLVLFKYDQIESDFSLDIVRECRGIILDENNDWNVVCWSMPKFFNYQEGNAAAIDWTTAKIQEKLDGSLMQLFAYDGGWNVATSGGPSAAGNVGDYGFTFEKLFWDTFIAGKDEYKNCLPPVDCGKCFFFELTSIYNKIVVVHPEPCLTLLGARDLNTMQELTVEEAHAFFPDFKVARQFPLGSLDDIVKSFDTFSGSSMEGYVVCDAKFNRVKCKSPQYVSLHHLKDSLGGSRRALVEVVRKGEVDEVIAVMPEYKDILIEAKGKLDDLVKELEEAYTAVKDIVVQKDFALEIVKRKVRCTSALFTLRAGKTQSIRHYLCEMHIDSVMGLLGYKTEK